MKHKTKKLLAISLGLLSVVAIFSWYFFPVLMAKWFLYNNAGLQRYLNVSPTYIEKLPEPPEEWDRISIDTLTLRLPMSKYKKVSGIDNHVRLVSEQGSLLLLNLVPPVELLQLIRENKLKYPPVSYEDKLAILKALPSDISFLNSRSKNRRNSVNLILKNITIHSIGLGDVLVVNPRILKAICVLSEKRENGFTAIVDVYSQNENVILHFMLLNYNDKAALNSDLLSLLGGIRMPDQPLDAVKVINDIDTIVKGYKGTEEGAQTTPE